MATTLAELAINSQDKLKQGFINELITDSYILNMMPFDDCLSANGTSDLVYAYKRVETGASAAFRSLNEEPNASEVKIKRVTTKPGILSSKWEMDRVAKTAAEDLYELKVAESKNAIIRKFNATLIAGDTATEEKGFDGQAKALKDSSTEFSQKPEEARRRGEALMGDVPRIELFARASPPGWDVWGNEVASDIRLAERM